MNMNKTAVLLIAASVACSAWAQAPAAVGKLAEVQGLVTIGAGDKLVNAVTGAPLVVGNRIVTTSSGAATLAFDSGCVVALKANESVVVTSGADCKALLASVTPVGGAAVAAAATGAAAQARPPTLSRRCSVSASSRPLPVGVRAVRAAPRRSARSNAAGLSGLLINGACRPRCFWGGSVAPGLCAHHPGWQPSCGDGAARMAGPAGLAAAGRAMGRRHARPRPWHGTPPRGEPCCLRRRPGSWPGAPWTALVQLTPLPASLWAALPGRELYVQALAVAQAPAAAFRPLSLVPDATWVSVLAGIPLTAVFLLAHTCTPRQLTVLARALVVFALAQAVLGLLQKGPFPGLCI